MVKSMTGYGRGIYSDEQRSITVEIKAVNHRYCDISVKMPRRYSFAEEKIKAAAKEVLMRGKIEIGVSIDNFGKSETDVNLNLDAAKRYYDALTELGQNFNLSGDGQISLSLLAGMTDVLTTVPAAEDEEEFVRELMTALGEALTGISEMRAVEGEKLAADILKRAAIMENTKNAIAERAPKIEVEYKERLHTRINELLDGSVEISEERLALEAAVFADKSNITEELVRLGSHIDQLRSFINSEEEAVGKKIDFLVQEMNREANTIGSKANDMEITSRMLELKAEIEKIREQVQNIE
ncbi:MULTISPECIES: YicC/YloC family endoribonuclease [Mogibacterium]|mgnify:FL=1|uniref:YicC/YloC family endoribonuclease n=1 Tax=Mogibacterium TaxID=86331 RepID=UPI00027C5660|nr:MULTISPECIES: YicC/YloC family endoribonuclease [Mogibacterium]EJU21368.1 TIGR00255 family protein [Mogibacterium sp. CM50]